MPVRDPLVVLRPSAAADGRLGTVPAVLRPVPLRRGIRARTGRPPGLPRFRLDHHGTGVVLSYDRNWYSINYSGSW